MEAVPRRKKVFLGKSSLNFIIMVPVVSKVPHSQCHVIPVDIEYMKRGKLTPFLY